MDAAGGIASLMQYFKRCDVSLTCLANQNILGINGMGQRVDYFIVVVEQLHLYFYRGFRVRHKKHILKRLLSVLGLIGGEPFLKEGREGVAIDDHIVSF